MKVSIIIPAYNAEKTIGRLLDSLCGQTYTDFETIIVNDCSKDRTQEISETYREKLFIKIINLCENGGVSNARNVGMLEATGDYYLFVDSDDSVDCMYIEHMMRAKYCDYVVCEYRRDDEPKQENSRFETINLKEFKKNCFDLWKTFRITNVWGVRYSAHIIKNNKILFHTNMKWGEDTLFNMEYLKYCDNMTSLGCNDYVYYRTDGSASKKYEKSRYNDALIVAKEFSNFACDSQQLWMIKYMYWDMAVRHCINHLYDITSNEWKKQVWTDMRRAVKDEFFRTCIPDVLKHGTLDMKIYVLCMKFKSMRLYLMLSNILLN